MRMDKFIEWLQTHYKPEVEVVNIFWNEEDVAGAATDIGKELTKAETDEVIDRLTKYHDASIGINWDVIQYHIGEVVGER